MDVVAETAELGEVHRRTLHGSYFAGGDKRVVGGEIMACGEPEGVVEHRAGVFALQIPVSVVGEIYHSGSVSVGEEP